MTLINKANPTIAIIVAALTPELGIGINGKLPWRLKQEIKYFRDVTSKTTSSGNINAVVMGRRTWESIPAKFRPLSNRLNVVLTRQKQEGESSDDDVIYSSSLEEAFKSLEQYPKNIEKVFIIGGADVYNQCIIADKVKHILLTEIRSTTPIEMDTWLNFPIHASNSPWLKQPHEELEGFTGIKAAREDITEGDFRYRYTYWKKLE